MPYGESTDTDWSESFDDMGPGDWEQYMGGPDDDYFDPPLPPDEPEYGDYEVMAYGSEPVHSASRAGEDASAESGPMGGTLSDVVAWLTDSSLARPLRSGDGFYVVRGPLVRLRDGREVEVLEWLAALGAVPGARVGDYDLVYTPPGGPYREKLTFFRRVWPAPF